MNISAILSENYSDAKWSLNGDDYSGLEWNDASPKPSKKELEAQWPSVALNIEIRRIKGLRNRAFIADADPLFFGWQRGENTEQEWLDAVQSVRDTYPYPDAV